MLTQADRLTELARAIASVRAQQQVDLQLVLVANGAHLPQPEPPDRLIVLPENVGISGGRNVGATAADARLVMFLDDDAELLDSGLLAAVVDRFKADPRLGAMAIRLIDEHGRTQRRHVPRLGAGSAERSGPVTYFIGAACVVRAATFHGVEGFDARFFYAMEESDLSWRLLDAGWSIWYSADLKAFHPRTALSRHDGYARLTARNRLWMAWRLLPAPMLAGYLLTWTSIAVARGVALPEMLTGYREAWSARPVRRPIRWRGRRSYDRLRRDRYPGVGSGWLAKLAESLGVRRQRSAPRRDVYGGRRSARPVRRCAGLPPPRRAGTDRHRRQDHRPRQTVDRRRAGHRGGR